MSRSPSPFDFSTSPIPSRVSSPAPSPSPSLRSPSLPPLPPLPPTSSAKRHPEYYLDDELVIFRVEDKLFRVNRYFLIRESEFFRTMFELPPGAADVEGTHDAAAIPLLQVTCSEFEALLHFVYKGMHDDNQLNLPQWIDLLSFSTRFICDRIRERAIREIDGHYPRVDPVVKIVLATMYSIPQWLAPSYEAICQRANPLEVDEAIKLGTETTTLLARAREAVRQEPIESRPALTPPPPESGGVAWPGLTTTDSYEPYRSPRVAEIVREVFWPPSPEAPLGA
ncbi:uncharacterized protein FIBRA_01384 [Fibroporia radiculosa]|uniref:BTB domain-containing protein n=1 Tax=Fibroporia radiculosa TaxID=599839 RepID=J4I8G4_9APHY|nr:uncharacterized protein FIBRA_01384 [Fibroporia radiculosa]CCL99366.1 predicted protein [Fibroporia radiculosa]